MAICILCNSNSFFSIHLLYGITHADQQELNVPATFPIRMKRNPIIRSSGSWQLQIEDSKIKGVRSIGIISTPIVWPIKQRPTSSEKISTTKMPVNFWFLTITTHPSWSVPTNQRVTTESRLIESTQEEMSTYKALSKSMSEVFRNSTSNESLVSTRGDEFSEDEAKGSGSQNEWYLVPFMKLNNTSSNSSHHSYSDINQTWWLKWLSYLNDKDSPSSNDKKIVKSGSEYSKISTYLLADLKSKNMTSGVNESLHHDRHRVSYLLHENNASSLENLILTMEITVKENGDFTDFLSTSMKGIHSYEASMEAKYSSEFLSPSLEFEGIEESIQIAQPASAIPRNKYTQSIFSTEIVSCNVFSSCMTVYTELDAVTKLSLTHSKHLLGSLMVHKANIQHISVNNMQTFLYIQPSMTQEALSIPGDMAQEEFYKEELMPLQKSSVIPSDLVTTSYDNQHLQWKSHDLLSSSYDVRDEQWRGITLKYNSPSETLKVLMKGSDFTPTAELPFDSSFVEEVVSPPPSSKINEEEDEVSGDENFLEVEKLYLVSGMSMVETTNGNENYSQINFELDITPTKTVALNTTFNASFQPMGYYNSLSTVVNSSVSMGTESFQNITGSEVSMLWALTNVKPLKTSNTLEDTIQISSPLPIIASYTSTVKDKLLPCTVQALVNLEQQFQEANANPEFIEGQSSLAFMEISLLAKEMNILTASSTFNDGFVQQTNILDETKLLGTGHSIYSATPPLMNGYSILTLHTHSVYTGHDLSITNTLSPEDINTQSEAARADMPILSRSSMTGVLSYYGIQTTVSDIQIGSTNTEANISDMPSGNTALELLPLDFIISIRTDDTVTPNSELTQISKDASLALEAQSFINNTPQKYISNETFEEPAWSPPVLHCDCTFTADVACLCEQEFEKSSMYID